MGLYLVPGTRENLTRTIEKPLEDDGALALLDAALLAELRRRSGAEGLRLWAMTRTLRKAFDAMQPGDDVLITEKGTGHFTHYGQVIGKTESRALGDRIWPVVGENPWELIYFLRNVRRIRVPKQQLLPALGYTNAEDTVAGARRARGDGVEAFITLHGPVAEWLGVSAGTDDLAPIDEKDEDFTGDDLPTAAKRRQGHQLFARRVKTNYDNACAICGISEDRFLVAGHIVGWAEDKANRLNPANGICLCVLHDRAFEAGFVTLDEQLRVIVSPKIPPSSPLGQQLHAFANQKLRLPSKFPPAEQFLVEHRRRLLQ